MADYVTDTMAFILHLEKRRMSKLAKTAYLEMEKGSNKIYVPTFVLAELLYLSEKQRISISLTEAEKYIQNHAHCQEYPLDIAVLQATARIKDIAELHDRLIAGTAVHLSLPLITNGPIITDSQHLTTVW